MKNLVYVQICDYIMNNPRKSEANYIKELSKIIKDAKKDDIKSKIEYLAYECVLIEEEKRFRQVKYKTYTVNSEEMDRFLKSLNNRSVDIDEEKSILKAIKALKNNNINAKQVFSIKELHSEISNLLKDGDTVSCGGSQTLFQTGIIDLLKNGNYNYLDRYDDNLTKDELKNLFRKCFFANAYFSSVNALTEDGLIFNVDANGNRVAPMLFGPDKVILVVGKNKIVKTLEDAISRNKTISGPLNSKRISAKTPCVKVGRCMDCNSPERICCEYTVIKRQKEKDRIYVFVIDESYGF